MRVARLALLVMMFGRAAAAQSVPAASVNSGTFHFESAKQGDPLAHTFVLRNAGTAPLRILALELTPGLRLSRMPAQVAPGGHVELPISLDTSGLSGAYEGQIRLRVNDPRHPVIEFIVNGTVVPPVEFTPFAAFFVSGQRGAGGEDSIDVVNHQETPLRIVGIDAPTGRFTTRLDTIESGQRYRLTLILNPDDTAGQRQDVIVLRTDDGRRLRVVANTRLRERVYTFPESIDFGEAPQAAPTPALLGTLAQTLMVYQVGGSQFRATFSSDIPGLQIHAEPGPKGDRWQATLTLSTPAVAAGPLRGSVIVETNDPEFSRITVPVGSAFTSHSP